LKPDNRTAVCASTKWAVPKPSFVEPIVKNQVMGTKWSYHNQQGNVRMQQNKADNMADGRVQVEVAVVVTDVA